MKILIDAMGGDNAPGEIVAGAVHAKTELDCELVLIGDRSQIEAVAEERELSLEEIEIVHTESVITMEDSPLVIRERLDSSMGIGIEMLKRGEGDALVSAGNTGALHAGSTLFVRRIPGIQRSAIATILPLAKPTMLIDSGANATVTAEHLLQFGVMGSIYMNNIFGIESPEVGLLNIGTEDCKGTQLQQDANRLLKAAEGINFIGNIEGRDIPFGKCDVIVTDGFTGNIVLKLIEGCSSYMMKEIKGMFTKNPMTKLSAAMMSGQLGAFKRKFDSSEYGGAPFLGIAKPVIKAHGSSNAKAIKNAVRQAISYSETGIIAEIAEQVKTVK
ncbi:MAG: phosphate acyltransferase PlsX [Clostridia bacterium]|nr:phosphate acyltransferase PlsX [Clostridia bacterium]